jgi:hypothetical protein
LETNDGHRHLVGARADDVDGRVSTAVVGLDVSLQVAVTQSGRIYQLSGPPGYSADGQYVWDRWRAVNGVASYEDVTSTAFSTVS